MAETVALIENGVVVNVALAEPDWEPPFGRWVRSPLTATNGAVTEAGIGMTFDEVQRAFYWPEAPFPSWAFNATTFTWDPPTPRPGEQWLWDEASLQWRAWADPV